MSIKDQIPADDRKSEVVPVPEWNDLKVVIKELDSGSRNQYMLAGMERVEVAGGYDFLPVNNPKRQALLVVLSAFEEDGTTRAFADDDVDYLAARSAGAIDRLAKVARRLSNLNGDAEEEAGKASEPTETGSSSSS